jgi:hypothetical protein
MTRVLDLVEQQDFSGTAILRHGFTDYMRDYELIVGARGGLPGDDLHRYQFVGCVEANVRTSVDASTFVQSLGDEFVYSGPDFPNKPQPDGFIWGVRYSTSTFGLSVVETSPLAAKWTHELGVSMTEATIHTEAFHIQLVFADLRYEFLGRDSEILAAKTFPIKVR